MATEIECTYMVKQEATIQQAKKEIKNVLTRYGLSWRQIVSDVDQEIWQEIAPEAKRIRKELFREKYPTLYGSQGKA